MLREVAFSSVSLYVLHMKSAPFQMTTSDRGAVLKRDGKFVVGGRASFAWETFLQSRAAGVPGHYEICSGNGKVWHVLEWTIEEAEQALESSGMFGKRRVAQMRRMRQGRLDRGLPVG